MVSNIYGSLPGNAIVKLTQAHAEDIQGKEKFLAPSADKHPGNYDTDCSNHHPLRSLRSTGIEQ